MRVGYIVNNTFTEGMGGADHSLLNSLRELMRLGVEPVCVLPARTSLGAPLRRIGALVVEAAYPNSLFLGGRVRHGLARRQRALFQERRAARSVATIFTRHDVALVHSNSAVIRTGAIAAKFAGKPHVWHIRESFENHGRIDAASGWRCYWASMREAAARIAVSNYAAEQLRKRQADLDVDIIYNGVIANASAAPTPRNGNAHAPFRVLLIGGLSKQKSPDLAVRAVRLLHDRGMKCTLRIVGSGAKDWLVSLVDELDLAEYVIFTGRVESPWDVLPEADALVSCGVGEAMGRVVAEAMCAGVPVLGRNSGATPEIVRPDRDGFIFDDAEGLAEGLANVMRDYSQALSVAGVARERAIKLFTDERCAAEIYRVYERVLEAAA